MFVCSPTSGALWGAIQNLEEVSCQAVFFPPAAAASPSGARVVFLDLALSPSDLPPGFGWPPLLHSLPSNTAAGKPVATVLPGRCSSLPGLVCSGLLSPGQKQHLSLGGEDFPTQALASQWGHGCYLPWLSLFLKSGRLPRSSEPPASLPEAGSPCSPRCTWERSAAR